jgi:hypothetical protein
LTGRRLPAHSAFPRPLPRLLCWFHEFLYKRGSLLQSPCAWKQGKHDVVPVHKPGNCAQTTCWPSVPRLSRPQPAVCSQKHLTRQSHSSHRKQLLAYNHASQETAHPSQLLIRSESHGHSVSCHCPRLPVTAIPGQPWRGSRPQCGRLRLVLNCSDKSVPSRHQYFAHDMDKVLDGGGIGIHRCSTH